jgi:hypothetical protein
MKATSMSPFNARSVSGGATGEWLPFGLTAGKRMAIALLMAFGHRMENALHLSKI